MFAVFYGAELVARREGSFWDELRGRGWPDTDDVLARLAELAKADPGSP